METKDNIRFLLLQCCFNFCSSTSLREVGRVAGGLLEITINFSAVIRLNLRDLPLPIKPLSWIITRDVISSGSLADGLAKAEAISNPFVQQQEWRGWDTIVLGGDYYLIYNSSFYYRRRSGGLFPLRGQRGRIGGGNGRQGSIATANCGLFAKHPLGSSGKTSDVTNHARASDATPR